MLIHQIMIMKDSISLIEKRYQQVKLPEISSKELAAKESEIGLLMPI